MQNESANKSPVTARRHHMREYVRWSDVDVSGIIRWGTYVRFVFAVKKPGGDLAAARYTSRWRQNNNCAAQQATRRRSA